MKALLTGSTPIQVGSQRTQLKIITAAEAWKNALEAIGYDVDWRPVTPGEDLSDYDAVLAIFNQPNSITSSYFHGALWATIAAPRVAVALDDWQTDGLISGIKTCARSKERFFRLRGSELPDDVKNVLFEALGELANNVPWKFKVIAPILGAADVGKLNIPATVVGIDPTSFTRRYERNTSRTRDKRWIMATLLDKPPPVGLSWPVDIYGPQNRGPGGAGQRGAEAKPRVPESELMDIYGRAWGVLSPAHPHAGSGWWRVRYLMAADAGAILSADPAEAAALGGPYVEASDPHVVERATFGRLILMAEDQQKYLETVKWSRFRVTETLETTFTKLGGRRMALKFTAPTKRPEAPPVAPAATPKPRGRPKAEASSQTWTDSAPPKEDGEGSGAYMRRLMKSGINDTAIILAAVHENFPESKAGPSDVNYNRVWLRKKEGFDPASRAWSVNVPAVSRPTAERFAASEDDVAPVKAKKAKPIDPPFDVAPTASFNPAATFLRGFAEGLRRAADAMDKTAKEIDR